MPERDDERGWDRGWEGHTIAQRQRLGRLSLREKLEWLEEAQRVVMHLTRKQPPAREGDTTPRS